MGVSENGTTEKRTVSNIRLETVNYKCFIGIFEKLTKLA